MSEVSLFCHNLDFHARSATDLPAPAWLKFNIMDNGPQWNIVKRQGVTRSNISIRSRLHPAPNSQTNRGENVSLLSVDIIQQCNASGPVRVVLDGVHRSGNAAFVRFEIELAVKPLVSTPRRRLVMRPRLLRPPLFLFDSIRDFSGRDLVISSKDETVLKRNPGVIGRKDLTAISMLPQTSQCSHHRRELRLLSSSLPAGLEISRAA